MSPLWRDQIGVFIGPGKLVLARLKRGIRPQFVAQHGVCVEPSINGDWDLALAALRQQTEQELWQDANVRVVVSDHWARYAMLPWSPNLTRDAERMAHARLILREAYGDVADQWTVRLSDSTPRAATIISAMPTALLDDLKAAFAPPKFRIISLQPNLITSFNNWRDKLPQTSAWFASIDDGSLAALHLTDGHCDRVRSVRISDDWTLEMRRMQTIGRLALSRPAEGKVFVDAPEWMRAEASNDDALEWLDEAGNPQSIANKLTQLRGLYA